MPIATYFFANVCLLVKTKRERSWIVEFLLNLTRHCSFLNSITNYFDDYSTKIILVLTEERVAQNILVIPGGESTYKNLEQFIDTALRRAGKEELGVELDPKKIILFDVQIGYPIEGNPYKEKGITSVIVSYLCYITEEELASIAINTVSVEGCDIVKIVAMPVPDALEAIKNGEINVYPALLLTLQKLEKYLQEGN